MWNRSRSSYLICFHSPRDIIDSYEFHVKLLVQTPTSMHGSNEGHAGYVYERCAAPPPSNDVDDGKINDGLREGDDRVVATVIATEGVETGASDATGDDARVVEPWEVGDELFVEPCRIIQSGLSNLKAHVDAKVKDYFEDKSNSSRRRATRAMSAAT